MDTWNRLTDLRAGGGLEEMNQEFICIMHGPSHGQSTAAWRKARGGGMGDICNSVNNKKKVSCHEVPGT